MKTLQLIRWQQRSWDRAGIHEGTIFRYHQARRNTRNYQVDMETLQYDVLYGKKYSYDGGSRSRGPRCGWDFMM